MAQSPMIEVDNLGRYFGDIKAVDGITFSVDRGDVLGFLGPNGAGKSTTMKVLTCFLRPSFGHAKINGFDVSEHSRDVRKCLGYLPENAPLYGEMAVIEFLDFIAEVRGIGARKRKSAIDCVVDMISLQAVTTQRIETLSKGFKRRVGLAQALIHDPDILILDEPTDGLDPNQKHDVRALINSMAKDKCIVLSTHILEEVDAVCNRAIIISEGKIVADDTPEKLRASSHLHGAVTMTFREAPLEEIVGSLKEIEGVREVEVLELPNGEVIVTAFPNDNAQVLAQVVNEAESRKWPFHNLRLERGELDEVFRDITQ